MKKIVIVQTTSGLSDKDLEKTFSRMKLNGYSSKEIKTFKETGQLKTEHVPDGDWDNLKFTQEYQLMDDDCDTKEKD